VSDLVRAGAGGVSAAQAQGSGKGPAEAPDTEAPWAGPDPEFAVLGARAVRHAAAPMVTLDLQISEPTGRQVYMIALRIQLMLEPARRAYDQRSRNALQELFGAPERWALTTRPLLWSQLDVLVPAFTAMTTVPVTIPCSYDLELAATKYLHGLADGFAPIALHFNGTIYYRGEDGRLQMVLVPWTKSVDFRLPVATWREAIEQHYPGTAWLALRNSTVEALRREKLRRGVATLDQTVLALLDEVGAQGESADHDNQSTTDPSPDGGRGNQRDVV